MKKIGIISVTCAVLLLSACGGKDDDSETKPLESAEKLYNEARDKYDAHDYKEAAKSYDEVERQHPSSEWANNAQIMSAYSSYKVSDYDTAIGTLERYVKLYPSSDSTPYAYYLLALCYYEQISDVGRDQKMTEKALQALREVVRRFPDTEYARDSKIKQDLTIDHLAGKEMEIGRYYLRHDDYLAAVNRFRLVVETYQTTTHVPEALHRLVECYLKLGIPDEALRYASVLGYNYPGSSWYKDTYKLMTSDLAKPVIPKPVEAKAAAPAPAAPAPSTVPPVSNAKAVEPAPEAAKKEEAASTPPAPTPAPASEPTPADTTSWWNFWSSDNAAKPAEAPAPAETKPPEAAPAPAEPKPAEAKPAETVPPVVVAPRIEIRPKDYMPPAKPAEAAPEQPAPEKEWWNFWDSSSEDAKPADAAATPAPADPTPADATPPGTKRWWDFMIP